MKYHEKKEKEKHLLYLIQEKRLTSLEKLTKDFNCSKRTLERMLSDLRIEGHKIEYCKCDKKYFLDRQNLAE